MTDSSKAAPFINRLVSAEVLALKAYHAPYAPGLIKLDAMENPYSLTDTMKDEWLDCLASIQVNRYPDSNCTELKSAIRKCYSVPDHYGLMLGNGSDELIQIIAMATGGAGRIILAPVPTFSMYQQISTATGTQFEGVPLDSRFMLDAEMLARAIRKYEPACTFFAYPNNPTGNCFDPSIITRTLKESPGLVVVDEAYFAFCQKTFLAEIEANPNLLVLRTMSKSGLAGLRLGLLLGNPGWIEQLEKLRLPYNINCFTQASSQFFFRNYELLQKQAEKIIVHRNWVFRELEKFHEIEVFPSEANFLLFRVKQDPDGVFEGLRERGILIKNLHKQSSPEDGALQNCLRVTIGTEQENGAFIEALGSL